MEKEIVERILENEKMLSEEEKNLVIKNSKTIAKVYIISMMDTYKTIKDA